MMMYSSEIKELAKQAELYSLMWVGDEAREALLEKFAELIIEKCCEIADSSVDHCNPSKYINKHFGIAWMIK